MTANGANDVGTSRWTKPIDELMTIFDQKINGSLINVEVF